MGTVDWHALAHKLDTLYPDGEKGGSDLGRQALELIVGVDALRSAVDYYIAGDPGSQLAHSVLAFLQPSSAMERCLEIARSDADADSRRLAVGLLQVVADRRGIGWAAEFLRDEDEGVQARGAAIVDQLLWTYRVEPEDCDRILEAMEGHPSAGVRRAAALLRDTMTSRRRPAGTADAPGPAGT